MAKESSSHNLLPRPLLEIIQIHQPLIDYSCVLSYWNYFHFHYQNCGRGEENGTFKYPHPTAKQGLLLNPTFYHKHCLHNLAAGMALMTGTY